ncbi:MAG: 1-acyl-sn-glycerol-3-phosphate acyltransferase, partial [Muribaculaceae bacterium]|nr:1-acyl-sn-glycerol-3-phosphate acyltransferase [Muribaculaceae bacterium]
MDRPLEINLHNILRDRLPRKVSRFLPGFLISGLEKVIHQDDLNDMLRVAFPLRGSAFSRKILEHLDITLEVKGLDNLEEGKRYMFASNHPLGGLDGIALIAVLGEKYGDDGVRFLVNDMLMNVEPLRDVFLPINKFGAQGRDAAKAINAALESDMQILQFPAGLVSRLHDDGTVSDLTWQKAFVAKAMETGRDIVPVHFEGLNSGRFYKAARWRKKLNIKVNLEQALLPGEVCRARGSHYRVTFGSPVS